MMNKTKLLIEAEKLIAIAQTNLAKTLEIARPALGNQTKSELFKAMCSIAEVARLVGNAVARSRKAGARC